MTIRESYVTVKLPMRLIKSIDDVIELGTGGYKSRSEFIKEAVRLRIEAILGVHFSPANPQKR